MQLPFTNREQHTQPIKKLKYLLSTKLRATLTQEGGGISNTIKTRRDEVHKEKTTC